MTDKHLHIVSLSVPFPVDYGGVVDIFYKIVALHAKGVKIHLHCFTSGRRRAPELNAYCEKVYYYPRRTGLAGFSLTTPYIVASRKSSTLVSRLLKDDHPILVEGIHCAALLNHSALAARKILLRLLNVEYRYYSALFASSTSPFKRAYYLLETFLLKRFEDSISRKPDMILALSETDKELYEHLFHAEKIAVLRAFTANQNVSSKPGSGTYCLYHGNLSVAENEAAADWLIREVFSGSSVPLIVAGRKPSAGLHELIERTANCTLVDNPDESQLAELIADAQCHVLPSFNTTGIKLKVINALFQGRHCIVNAAAVAGSGVGSLCIVADSAEKFREAVHAAFDRPFGEAEITKRKELLEKMYSNEENCENLIRRIW